MLGEPHVGAYALAARRRLELLSEASARIGTTLDVRRTAEELAETAVPRLADFVTIDLPDAVLRGEESSGPLTDLRRTVLHGVREGLPFTPPGKRIDFGPTSPQTALPEQRRGGTGTGPERRRRLARTGPRVHRTPAGPRPLPHRGAPARPRRRPGHRQLLPRRRRPFGDDDRSLAQELAARAALSIDNARRYTHERTMVPGPPAPASPAWPARPGRRRGRPSLPARRIRRGRRLVRRHPPLRCPRRPPRR